MDVVTGLKAAEAGLRLLTHLKESAGPRVEPSLLRMVYLELRRNLEILEAINLDGERELPASDVAYAQAAASLSVQALYALILGVEEPGLLDRILHSTVDLRELEVETGREQKRDRTPLPEAARFLYVKIGALQAISRLDERIRVDLRLRTRLRNIRRSCRALEEAMRALEDVRPIA
jgi:hypothetical protein